MSKAGGLLYHLRAARFSRRLWGPFREALDGWLENCWTPSEHLVLVGPSAGYCLTDRFLGAFQRIDVLEPDPVARLLLGRRLRRLPGVACRFVAEDLLVGPVLGDQEGLHFFLQERPGASVLFSNLLGQMRLVVPPGRFDDWQAAWSRAVLPALSGRPWASFHDRVSSTIPPRLAQGRKEPRRLRDDEMVRTFYAQGDVRAPRVELFDHSTDALFPHDLPHAYFHWAIDPGTHHLIEAVCSPPRVAPSSR